MASVSLQDGSACKLPNYIATIQALHKLEMKCAEHTHWLVHNIFLAHLVSADGIILEFLQ